MFQQNGLSLDQAPPISVVFKLFFGASLFGILAGALVLFYQTDIFDASSTAAITLTHTLTLGVMASFMLGALFQMLPVIAGVVIDAPAKKSWWIQLPFVLGTISLLLAFNLPQYHHLYWLAAILLGVSLLGAAVMMLKNLAAIQYHTSSSKGMVLALISFTILVCLALYLTLSLGGLSEGVYYSQAREIHYSFGLFGWIALLIISISFQVIEMFYVTPPYPGWMTKGMTLTILILLMMKAAAEMLLPAYTLAADIAIALLLIIFASITLYRLTQRKRPLADATIWFWRTGMASLITAMLLWLLSMAIESNEVVALSYLAYISFALSIVFAMFYKIVPFLTWFHLNAQGYYSAPMMHEVIHPKTAKKHYWIHLAMILSFLLSLFVNKIVFLAGLLTILSFAWISWQIVHAYRLYRKTEASGEKFEMSA